MQENNITGNLEFQFHIGPITTGILVYLSLDKVEFQFHIGPITTNFGCLRKDIMVEFQFHIGPITTAGIEIIQVKIFSFNSTLVRLQLLIFMLMQIT